MPSGGAWVVQVAPFGMPWVSQRGKQEKNLLTQKFSNFGYAEALALRKAQINLAFPSFFCNFVRFLSFSLYKGSLED